MAVFYDLPLHAGVYNLYWQPGPSLVLLTSSFWIFTEQWCRLCLGGQYMVASTVKQNVQALSQKAWNGKVDIEEIWKTFNPPLKKGECTCMYTGFFFFFFLKQFRTSSLILTTYTMTFEAGCTVFDLWEPESSQTPWRVYKSQATFLTG